MLLRGGLFYRCTKSSSVGSCCWPNIDVPKEVRQPDSNSTQFMVWLCLSDVSISDDI